MPVIADFPRLKLCEPCSRLLTDFKDGTNDKSIQWYIWNGKEGYRYYRTVRELKDAAGLGCAFCKRIFPKMRIPRNKTRLDKQLALRIQCEGSRILHIRHDGETPESDEELGIIFPWREPRGIKLSIYTTPGECTHEGQIPVEL